MQKAKTFRDLGVWQKAHSLVLKIYEITNNFPDIEKYGLVAQMRRSSASVPANIVKGFSRRSKKRLCSFCNYGK